MMQNTIWYFVNNPSTKQYTSTDSELVYTNFSRRNLDIWLLDEFLQFLVPDEQTEDLGKELIAHYLWHVWKCEKNNKYQNPGLPPFHQRILRTILPSDCFQLVLRHYLKIHQQQCFVEVDDPAASSILVAAFCLNFPSVIGMHLHTALRRFQQRVVVSKVYQNMEAMRYYVSVGELLIQQRESGAGKVGIICPKDFVTGDWIRAISDIMQCERGIVRLKVI